MRTLFILPIEPIESRYTAEWHRHIPLQITAFAKDAGIPWTVKQVNGRGAPANVPKGQFLDFAGTSIYKSTQMAEMAKRISSGDVSDGDVILVTDAWNPAVLQLRLMLDMLKIRADIHGIWHAGSYDPTDLLGLGIKDKTWSHATERAMFAAYEENYFATRYHVETFCNALNISMTDRWKKIKTVGWPMEYIADRVKHVSATREKIIVFPHRISPDKRPLMFIDVAHEMRNSGYEFVFTQEQNLSKDEYHNLLSRATLAVSMAQHEMLGISMYEAAINGCIPLVPNRLSYREMYPTAFRYPSSWSLNHASQSRYAGDVQHLVSRIRSTLDNQVLLRTKLEQAMPDLHKFFNGRTGKMYENVLADQKPNKTERPTRKRS